MTNKTLFLVSILGLILVPNLAGAQYYTGLYPQNQYQYQTQYQSYPYSYPYNYNYGSVLGATYNQYYPYQQYQQNSPGCNFTVNLSLGSTHPQVADLNRMLGVGEGSYFGTATYNAVVRFQNQYASEVLYPAGLTYGTGFVGAMTRAKLNSLCNGQAYMQMGTYNMYGTVLGATYPYNYSYNYSNNYSYPYLPTGQAGNYNYQTYPTYIPPVTNTNTSNISINFYANPANVYSGGSTQINWTAYNASSCTASGSWSGSKSTTGNETIYPTYSNRTYTLTCTSTNGASISQTLTVGVL
ncbi:MAG: hypothetical protein AAB590_00145 [Patescibacteria group bacterium]